MRERSLVQYTVQAGVQNCIKCFDCPAGTHIRHSTWVPIEVQINFRLVPLHIHIICMNNMYYIIIRIIHHFFHIINTLYACIKYYNIVLLGDTMYKKTQIPYILLKLPLSTLQIGIT